MTVETLILLVMLRRLAATTSSSVAVRAARMVSLALAFAKAYAIASPGPCPPPVMRTVHGFGRWTLAESVLAGASWCLVLVTLYPVWAGMA